MNKPLINTEVPLPEKMRPNKLEEMVGQEHLLGPDCLIPKALKSGRIFSVIFWGPLVPARPLWQD